MRRCGSGFVLLLEVVDLAVADVAFEGDDLRAEEPAFKGEDLVDARWRAAEVVSVRSK